MVVVLPAPLGPSRPKHSPVRTSSSRPSTATTSLNVLRKLRTCRAATGMAGSLSLVSRPSAAPSNPAASSITAEIYLNSINTREPDRDKHLKSADFFDAANYPTIKFQSKKVEADGPEAYKVTGDLTIRGATHEVALYVTGPTPEIKDPWGYTRRGAEAVA